MWLFTIPSLKLTPKAAPAVALVVAFATGCDSQPSDPLMTASRADQPIWLTPERSVPAEATDGVSFGLAQNTGASPAAAQLPIYERRSYEVCAGEVYQDIYGVRRTGTKTCAKKACGKTNETDCTAGGHYRAVDISKIKPALMAKGYPLAGVVGSYDPGVFKACKSNNETYCTSNSSYAAMDNYYLNASNFKRGHVISGILTGSYPSPTAQIVAAGVNTRQLTPGNFNTAIRTVNQYHFWDAAGQFTLVNGDPKLQSANIVEGQSIYGVPGSLKTAKPTPCSQDGQVDCEIGGEWIAVDKTKLKSADIRNGVKMGGVMGLYPSPNVPLAGSASWVADLTQNIYQQLQQDKQYEYFNRAGERFVENGDSNFKEANLKLGVKALGITGTFNGVDYEKVDAWDIKKGVTIKGTKKGLLEQTASCSSKQDCFAKTIWVDRSKAANKSTSDCAANSGKCLFRHNVSGLDWAFEINGTQRIWHDAARYCSSLQYDGKQDWRLATQKEVMHAVVNGLLHLGHFAHYQNRGNAPFWAATADKTYSGRPNSRVVVYAGDQTFDTLPFTSGKADVMCVRRFKAE